MKKKLAVATATLGLVLASWLVLSAVDVWIFQSIDRLGRLEARNSCEVVMGELFASLRDHDDFGSAIEGSEALKGQILGLGLYSEAGEVVYSWGSVPPRFAASKVDLGGGPLAGRILQENPAQNSFILLVQPFSLVGPPAGPPGPPRPPLQAQELPPPGPGPGPAELSHPFLFTTLKKAEVVYLEISQSDFWAAHRVRQVLFPLSEILLGALLFCIRSLYLRNRDYRRSLEEQRSLVVLGTAASTLAHEIKNPLLSIRLQSSILEKLCPEGARRELSIINAEVERLSALSYRVNDWLREPVGQPVVLEVQGFLKEVCARLLGSEPVEALGQGPFLVRVDADRLRSVSENLLRNALESGSLLEGIRIEVWRGEALVGFDVLDRGTGIDPANRERVFDPFYTTKSRGSGIGLAISRRFIEAAGGSIRIEAREGGGTKVSVRLPASPSETIHSTKEEQ